MSYVNYNKITYVVFESSSGVRDHSNGTSQPYFFDVICFSVIFYFITK